MKKLILVRHGKSSWKHEVQDSQRPLKARAYKDAGKVVKAFMARRQGDLVIWSSPAVRALESARIFKEELGIGDEKFSVRKELYTFDDLKLTEVIASCDDSIEQLMVFGHNPAMTDVVNSLGNEVFTNIPTTGLTVIEFNTDSWKDLRDGTTVFSLFPKNL